MMIPVSHRILLILAATLLAVVMAVPSVSAQTNPCGEFCPSPPGGGKGDKNEAKCKKVDKPAHVTKCHKRR
jgi:hypothetical protein